MKRGILKNCKTGMMRIAITALVLCMFFILIFLGAPNIADALLPYSYQSAVIDEGKEWWTGDGYLGLEKLKTTVNSWRGNSEYDFEYLKKNPIVIAVIDSGVNIEHELFCGKYNALGKSDANAVDARGVGLYDVLLRDRDGNAVLKNTVKDHGYSENDIADDEVRKHGTHVAGIVALLIHALELEEYIKILPIKASYHYKTLLDGEKDSFNGKDVNSAVSFAIDQGADVINMSISSDGIGFAGLNNSIAHTKAVLVAAAGNDGSNIKRYPAALPNVIGVMNYAHTDDGKIVLSNSSNYGNYYDLCASGAEIYSANGLINLENGFEYKSLSGTSMASPIVSFGAALFAMKSKALAGENGNKISSVALAERVRNAYTEVVTQNENDADVGNRKVFDINKLVGEVSYDAQIEVADENLLNQKLGSIQQVNFRLSVVPSSEYGTGSVEWFADDEMIGSGFEIFYTPKSEYGTTTVKAIWKHRGGNGDVEQTASVEIFVDYMPVTSSVVEGFELVANLDGDILDEITAYGIGNTYSFSVVGIENILLDTAKNCLWFVNGEFKHTGVKFEFTPDEEGEYAIKVRLNGYDSREKIITVSTPKADTSHERELRILTIVFCSVAAMSALLMAIVIIVRRKKIDGTKMQ